MGHYMRETKKELTEVQVQFKIDGKKRQRTFRIDPESVFGRAMSEEDFILWRLRREFPYNLIRFKVVRREQVRERIPSWMFD